MRKILLLIFVLVTKTIIAQDIPGYNTSNYAGVSGIDLQPASIADMRYKADITLVGVDFGVYNNYIGVNSKSVLDQSIFKPFFGDFKQQFLYENSSSVDKSAAVNYNVQLPSFAIAINKNISIGFTSRIRGLVNIDQLSPELAHLAYTGLDYNDAKNLTYWNVKLNNDKFNFNEMTWAEYGLSYAQVLMNTGPHFLKLGGRIKLENGIQAAYIYAENLSYAWKNKDTLSLYNSHFAYGETQNVSNVFAQNTNIPNLLKSVSSSSVAFDIGTVYEWRPDYGSFLYDMDGQTNLERRDKNKYKLRIGASILDIGSIQFNKGNGTYDFLADTSHWKVKGTTLGKNPALGLDSLVSHVFPDQSKGNKNTFVFALPTAFSVQIDYNIYKDLYVNFTSYTSPRWLDIESKVHQVSYYSITPRWDSKWFGVFLPIAVNGYGQTIMGAALHIGPIIVGSSQILSALVSNNMYGMDIHAAIKIPIYQGKPPRDRDHDGVSDKYDKCPDLKGTWAHHGCPDSDGDGIYDDLDKCPHEAGPIENNGCPLADRDGDGIPDKLDSCPDVKGPKENHGCPWGDADKDGVADNLDSCPHLAGPVENHGCPWPDADNDGVPDYLDSCPHLAGPVANHGCPWGDADNDGVPDNLDSCPHTPGPVSNHGCPVLAKKTQEIVNTAFNNLEFELNSSIIKKSSIKSIDELAKLMATHANYKLKLAGYTDNVGSEEKNLQLSKDRAMAVREALMAKGVDPKRIVVEYHGSADPIAPNDTEEGRAKNRRVEMKITFD